MVSVKLSLYCKVTIGKGLEVASSQALILQRPCNQCGRIDVFNIIKNMADWGGLVFSFCGINEAASTTSSQMNWRRQGDEVRIYRHLEWDSQ